MDVGLNKRANIILIGFSTVALGFTEYLFALGHDAYGILTALAFTLLLYSVISFVGADAAVVEVVEVLSLLFMYILLISSLPWFYIKQELLFPGVYLILIALCVWYMKNASLVPRDVGLQLPPSKKVLGVSLVIGVFTGAIEFLILRPPPALPHLTVGYLLQTTLVMVVFVGLGEELLFRGILLTNLEKVLDARLALVMDALVFTILHFTWRIVSEIVFVFLVGLLVGFIFQRTRSLLPPIILHAINNIVLIAIFPFL